MSDHTLDRAARAAADISFDSVMITDANNVILYVNEAFESLTGYRRTDVIGKTPGILQGDATEEERKLYAEPVKELRQALGLSEGEVVADFFLPYQCCSDCPPIQYSLPPVQLAMDVEIGCTGDDEAADVTVTVEGASGTVSVRVAPFASENAAQLTTPLASVPPFVAPTKVAPLGRESMRTASETELGPALVVITW